ncbi:MAG: type II toxin-antitoxin system RelE/ParE family toxin [candidate division WOR-3 bacterium]|nr:type II toxin-antitoxin system RelE/ParE family toxin [candidate division WOR-3 bacterium]
MARTVVWSETAWHDLEQVADYIAQDSRHYAAAFVREVRDAARSLATFAERGRIVPELSDPAVRELLVGRYRLMYRVTAATVQIVAFVHGARDFRGPQSAD